MFFLAKVINGRINVSEPVRLPATAGVEYKDGAALKLASGAAALATGDATATYVCLESKTGVSGGTILAVPVTDSMVFRVPITAYSATTQKVGLAVQISGDALQVTATAASSGVGAKIIDMNGASASGDEIYVTLK